MNRRLYYKQEKKIGKKFILYQEFNKKKSASKSRKEESNSDLLDNDDTYSNSYNSNAYIFIKKELGYLYVYLNRKN